MESSNDHPGLMPTNEAPTPGEPMSLHQHMLDKGAQLLQTLAPVKRMQQHICTFAMYSHDMTRQIETHHFVTRLNEDFLQCAVYDSDNGTGRLLGVEYIVSDRIFETLDPEEQKLWHSHMYEIQAGLWVNPRIPEMALAKSYGKFWCTWQVDRGDMLPMGAPALMMSPQENDLGQVKRHLIERRDDKYNMSRDALTQYRSEIQGPENGVNKNADYWTKTGKGFLLEVEKTDENHCAISIKTHKPHQSIRCLKARGLFLRVLISNLVLVCSVSVCVFGKISQTSCGVLLFQCSNSMCGFGVTYDQFEDDNKSSTVVQCQI